MRKDGKVRCIKYFNVLLSVQRVLIRIATILGSFDIGIYIMQEWTLTAMAPTENAISCFMTRIPLTQLRIGRSRTDLSFVQDQCSYRYSSAAFQKRFYTGILKVDAVEHAVGSRCAVPPITKQQHPVLAAICALALDCFPRKAAAKAFARGWLQTSSYFLMFKRITLT